MCFARTGTIIVSGAIGDAIITAGGPSKTFVRTVNGAVNVNLDEQAILNIDATAGRLPAFFNSPSCVVERCPVVLATT